MGGHGGLNILPQKRWNVYNFDNREKVRLDEEAAAKEEQLKREQSRKRDSELRLQQLRQARGLPPTQAEAEAGADDHNKPSSSKSIQPATSSSSSSPEKKPGSDSNHINLFEGIRIFDPIKAGDNDGERDRKKGRFDRSDEKKKVKKEEVRVVGPEDEKYRLGYGIAGKGVKLPWYMEKKVSDDVKKGGDESDDDDDAKLKKRKVEGKKTLEVLREERLNRERKEKERERALIMGKSRRDDVSSYHRRR